MKLQHVGIVVRDLAAYGEAYACTLGLIPDSEIVCDPIQDVRIQFWRDINGGISLELIEPASPSSPVCRALAKGGGLNHLCYEVGDIEAQVQQCLKNGGLLTNPLAPAVAFGGRRVAFVFFDKLNLIEFVEAPAESMSTGEDPHAV